MPNDWKDVILHGAAAAVVVAVFGLALRGLGWGALIWAVAAVNAVWWFVREWRQDVVRGNSPAWPGRYSSQKNWEATVPGIVGVVVAAVFWVWVL